MLLFAVYFVLKALNKLKITGHRKTLVLHQVPRKQSRGSYAAVVDHIERLVVKFLSSKGLHDVAAPVLEAVRGGLWVVGQSCLGLD
jgi:hypothetical protein